MYIRTDEQGKERFAKGFEDEVLNAIIDRWYNFRENEFIENLNENLYGDIYDTAKNIQKDRIKETAAKEGVNPGSVAKLPVEETIPDGYSTPQKATCLYAIAAHEKMKIDHHIDPEANDEPNEWIGILATEALTEKNGQPNYTENTFLGQPSTYGGQMRLFIDSCRIGEFDHLAAQQLACGLTDIDGDGGLLRNVVLSQETNEDAYNKLNKIVKMADEINGKPIATQHKRDKDIAALIPAQSESLDHEHVISFDGLRDLAAQKSKNSERLMSPLLRRGPSAQQAGKEADAGIEFS